LNGERAPRFEIQVAQVRAGVKLTVSGELDIATVPRLEHARDDALAVEPEWMLIDLGAVPFVDSSGLKFLLETHARSQREQWKLQLLKPAQTAMRVFTITGADRHLPFIDLDEG
jgi:anti-sigma B factor antagonist